MSTSSPASPEKEDVYLTRQTSALNPSSLLEEVLHRDRIVITVALVSVVTACWLYLLTGAGTGMYPHEMAVLVPAQTDGMSMSSVAWTPGYALLMFSMWWLMMTAMMLSSAAPVVLLHASVTRRGLARAGHGDSGAPSHRLRAVTTAFMAGYLAVWGAFSTAAVLGQWALERGDLFSPMMTSTSRLLGAGLVLAAGVWQLAPLKTACLRHCRSPIGFLSTHWRPGVRGAFTMGLRHGSFCLGCCWLLMALLFYAGVMNLIWIIGLALLVLAEKLMPAGVAFGRASGLLLVGWGAWLGSTAL